METRCFSVDSDPHGPRPNIYQRGLWGRGTLPLQGTFCHLCCVQSLQIHYSGPSETPSSLPWNARAVQHLLQSSHPSGERQLETKQAGNGRGEDEHKIYKSITFLFDYSRTKIHKHKSSSGKAQHTFISDRPWTLILGSSQSHIIYNTSQRADEIERCFTVQSLFQSGGFFAVSFSLLDCRLQVPIEHVTHSILSSPFSLGRDM